MKRYHCRKILIAAASLMSSFVWAQDPVVVDPKHHRVEFENDQIRVLRISFKPGESAPMHDHPCATAVGIHDGTLQFSFPDGTSRSAPIKQGQVIVAKPTKHQVENKGDSPVEVILVEMKKGAC